MNVKLGVFAEGQMSKEMVREAKQMLQEMALKYKCRFVLKSESDGEEQKSKTSGYAKSKFKAKFEDKSGSNNGDIYLSFGGEIEMEQ